MINNFLAILYVASGLCGLIYQTIWIRKFTLVFGSTLPAVSAVIAIFFLGLALGSWLLGRVSVSAKNPIRLYAIIECIIGIYALAFPALLAGMEAVYGRLYPSLSMHPASLQVVRLGIALLVLSADAPHGRHSPAPRTSLREGAEKSR